LMKNLVITGRNMQSKGGERWGVTICRLKSYIWHN
jgi:hypothetical protein